LNTKVNYRVLKSLCLTNEVHILIPYLRSILILSSLYEWKNLKQNGSEEFGKNSLLLNIIMTSVRWTAGFWEHDPEGSVWT